MQEKIWSCAQCYTCAARCPFGNSPGGLVMLMREAAIKHGMESAKNVLRPFSRVMLKLISTGNQLAPDMITKDAFPDWGPNVAKIDAPLKILRKAIPMPTLNTTETAWEVNLKTSVELYTIWEMTGVLDQLETIDENLFDVITDIMDEKRQDYRGLAGRAGRRSETPEAALPQRRSGHDRQAHDPDRRTFHRTRLGMARFQLSHAGRAASPPPGSSSTSTSARC